MLLCIYLYNYIVVTWSVLVKRKHCSCVCSKICYPVWAIGPNNQSIIWPEKRKKYIENKHCCTHEVRLYVFPLLLSVSKILATAVIFVCLNCKPVLNSVHKWSLHLSASLLCCVFQDVDTQKHFLHKHKINVIYIQRSEK